MEAAGWDAGRPNVSLPELNNHKRPRKSHTGGRLAHSDSVAGGLLCASVPLVVDQSRCPVSISWVGRGGIMHPGTLQYADCSRDLHPKASTSWTSNQLRICTVDRPSESSTSLDRGTFAETFHQQLYCATPGWLSCGTTASRPSRGLELSTEQLRYVIMVSGGFLITKHFDDYAHHGRDLPLAFLVVPSAWSSPKSEAFTAESFLDPSCQAKLTAPKTCPVPTDCLVFFLGHYEKESLTTTNLTTVGTRVRCCKPQKGDS